MLHASLLSKHITTSHPWKVHLAFTNFKNRGRHCISLFITRNCWNCTQYYGVSRVYYRSKFCTNTVTIVRVKAHSYHLHGQVLVFHKNTHKTAIFTSYFSIKMNKILAQLGSVHTKSHSVHYVHKLLLKIVIFYFSCQKASTKVIFPLKNCPPPSPEKNFQGKVPSRWRFSGKHSPIVKMLINAKGQQIISFIK